MLTGYVDTDKISIHAPRGGSDKNPVRQVGRNDRISIHAPRGGSDSAKVNDETDNHDFNPRSPWGERHVRRED